MSKLLNVSASPHIRENVNTTDIMFDVIVALLPASIFGVYNFGMQALITILITVASCVLTELLYELIMKQPITIGDLSAVVTGLLLALNLPHTVPWWMGVLGGVFAILVVKMLFGGLGQNIVNPALAARCFLMISFAGHMTTFALDGVTGPTPLAILKEGGKINLLSMFVGTTGGTIGETSVIALLIGAAYLLVKKVINWRIPVIYIATVVLFAGFFGKGFDPAYLAAQVCGGGLILGAFFMANDYVTSPITVGGQVIYAILLGVLTGVFRIYSGSAEGVSYAILFCNLLVPLIEKITIPKSFGKAGAKHGK